MRIWNATLLLGTAAAALTPVAYTAAEVIGHMTPAEPISEARIAKLPKAEQAAWTAYLARSKSLMAADKAALAAERAGNTNPAPTEPGPGGGAGMPLDKPAEWYGTPEARHVADNIVSFQTPAGGWGKNVDRTGPVRVKGQLWVPVEHLPAYAKTDIQADENWNYIGTIDNNATTTELRFLARTQAALPGAESEPYRAAFLKGLRYLFNAQFPNGGWPQVYPLQGGYHDALTFNDNAMTFVVVLMSDVGKAKGDYSFVPTAIAAEARASEAKGLAVMLRTQVVVNGTRTIWGQQHDALTLAPVGARNFEPIALSSDESADMLGFLMKQPNPSPAMRAAVTDGIAWLKAHAITGYEFTPKSDPQGRHLVAKPGAGPIWSRFYDMASFKPVFGDRDRAIRDDVNEVSLERRNGYSWYNNGPAKTIAAYDKWVAKTGG